MPCCQSALKTTSAAKFSSVGVIRSALPPSTTITGLQFTARAVLTVRCKSVCPLNVKFCFGLPNLLDEPAASIIMPVFSISGSEFNAGSFLQHFFDVPVVHACFIPQGIYAAFIQHRLYFSDNRKGNFISIIRADVDPCRAVNTLKLFIGN